jgi:hypothetical protein
MEKWREAKIVNIKGNGIRIHYLGWDRRWDENLDIIMNLSRIREYRGPAVVEKKWSHSINRFLQFKGSLMQLRDSLSIVQEVSECSKVSRQNSVSIIQTNFQG